MLGGRAQRQRRRDRLSLCREILERRVERAAREREAGVQRLVDPHFEPRLDAFPEKLDRYAIDERARDDADHCEHQHEPQRELEPNTRNLSLRRKPNS